MKGRGNKRIVASVETCEEPKVAKPSVSTARTVTLRFPNGQYGIAGYYDWTKALTPEEARAIGQSLIDAADEVEAQA